MEENPKSIARPRGCPPPTRYKKSTETSWDDQTSRCHDGNVAPVDDRNEVACRRPSSRGFSRRPIRPRKPLGSVNKQRPKRSVKNDEPRWRVASVKSTRENRSTVPLCDAIKGGPGGGRSITRHHGSTTPTTSQLSTQTPSPLPTRRRTVVLSRPSRRGRGQGPWPVKYKTEVVPEPVPLATWSDADGDDDDDDDDNEGDFYPFSCLCSWPAPRPLRPGR